MQINCICIEKEPGLQCIPNDGLILVQLNGPQLLSVHLPNPTAPANFNSFLHRRKILLALPPWMDGPQPGPSVYCHRIPKFIRQTRSHHIICRYGITPMFLPKATTSKLFLVLRAGCWLGPEKSTMVTLDLYKHHNTNIQPHLTPEVLKSSRKAKKLSVINWTEKKPCKTN